jgi:hypothetical protein
LLRWDQESEGERWEDWFVLLDAAGNEIATLGTDAGFIIPGPGGVIWTERLGPEVNSHLISSDEQADRPVPGLAAEEWVDGAVWSPDGSRVALVPFITQDDSSLIRVVEVATDTIIGEIAEPEQEVWPVAWSTDGRFLFYRQSDARGVPLDCVVYDTATGVATDLPVPEGAFVEQVRSSKSVPVVEQFTPVQWGIVIDEAGPGVHMLSMVVAARPLTPDQLEGLSGRLNWEEAVVDLCNINIRGEGADSLDIGDIFQTTEGCGANPNAMQEAFDAFGLPESACLVVTVGGVDHEYCAPLS